MYGIKKHVKGTFHSEDYLIWDKKTFKTLRYKYKESACFMADRLNQIDTSCRYSVVRLDDEHLS